MTQCIAYARSSRNIYIKNFTYFYVYAIEHVLLLPYMHCKKYREKKICPFLQNWDFFSQNEHFCSQNEHFFSQIGELFADMRTKMLIMRETVPDFGEKDRFLLTIFPSVEVWLDARIDDQLCAGF